VDEYQVEIAVRAELASAGPPYSHQGQTSVISTGRLVEQAGDPLVGCRRIGLAEGVAREVRLLDELVTPSTEGHGRTVPPDPRCTEGT
jgi:hypothetical protein